MDWRTQAHCRNADPELFFPAGPHTDERPAKDLCAVCPVIAQCLDWALVNQPHGIAGGQNEQERRRLRRARGMQRGHRAHQPPAGARPGEITAAGRAALLDGLSPGEIQRRFGVSERTVQRWAREHAIRRPAPA